MSGLSKIASPWLATEAQPHSTPSIAPLHSLALSIPKSELARMCLLYGPTLEQDLAHTEDGFGSPINGARLLWSMAGRESSFGRNLKPRHEPAYDVLGYYYRKDKQVQAGCSLYGRDFACSYGPLQIMACNAHGFTPLELGSDPEKAMGAAVSFLRLHVLRELGARTLAAICDSWNTGNFRDKNIPREYILEVTHYYITEVIA